LPAGSPSGAPKAAESSSVDSFEQRNAAVASLAAGYEQLRDRVLAGQPDGWRLGHGVLAGQGMVAWIGAWTTFTSAPNAAAGTSAHDPSTAPTTPSLSTTTSTPSSPAPTALSSLPCAPQLVAVLTQMALAHT